MVYVISSAGEYYKIGVAKNPIRRMVALQISSPVQLSIVAVADWPDAAERRVHAVLRQHRVRGEWFRPCAELRELIAAIQAGRSFNQWVMSRRDAPRRLRNILCMNRL